VYLINETEVSKENFQLPVENLAVWRGDGVFEALTIHDHFPFGIDNHIERLKQSCKKQLFENVDFSLIKNNILKIASQYKTGYVRVLILRDDSDEDFTIYSFYQLPIDIPENYSLESQPAPWHPGGDFEVNNDNIIGSKSTSYAYNIKQTREAIRNGFSDALLLSNKGVVLEGPTFSVGWIKDETIYVPDLDLGILDSITRKYLLKFGKENKISTAVSRITIDELYTVDTVFVMSTAKHGIFVSKIDNKTYTQSPLLNTLQNLFSEEVLKEKQKS
jgi:4-amino-4-deoxychorismate lyase